MKIIVFHLYLFLEYRFLKAQKTLYLYTWRIHLNFHYICGLVYDGFILRERDDEDE